MNILPLQMFESSAEDIDSNFIFDSFEQKAGAVFSSEHNTRSFLLHFSFITAVCTCAIPLLAGNLRCCAVLFLVPD
jgi:hypothetical protein